MLLNRHRYHIGFATINNSCQQHICDIWPLSWLRPELHTIYCNTDTVESVMNTILLNMHTKYSYYKVSSKPDIYHPTSLVLCCIAQPYKTWNGQNFTETWLVYMLRFHCGIHPVFNLYNLQRMEIHLADSLWFYNRDIATVKMGSPIRLHHVQEFAHRVFIADT